MTLSFTAETFDQCGAAAGHEQNVEVVAFEAAAEHVLHRHLDELHGRGSEAVARMVSGTEGTVGCAT